MAYSTAFVPVAVRPRRSDRGPFVRPARADVLPDPLSVIKGEVSVAADLLSYKRQLNGAQGAT